MWGRWKRQPVVPEDLVVRIDEVLARVETDRERLVALIRADAGLLARREAHRELRHRYVEADSLLREATALARTHSYREWSHWRHRLSVLGTARQQHLFLELDDSGVLPIDSIRAVDTGMSGPAIGEFQHGECSMPGKQATYGLDLEATLLALEEDPAVPAPVIELTSTPRTRAA